MHSWSTLRSFARDGSVANQKLTPGTVRRISGYAAPYRWPIVFFLVLTVVDAFLVVASPLLLGRLIDDGVDARQQAGRRHARSDRRRVWPSSTPSCHWFCAGTQLGSVRA